METAMVVLDGLILAWLVGTWFYEGHHRRCTVVTVCESCSKRSDTQCATHERNVQ